MMLIGNKETFAVEYELDSNYGGNWMFGKICYWINHVQVGDYELGTSLRDVLVAMIFLVPDCGNREELNLCELPPEEVFFQLNESIYGDTENVTIVGPRSISGGIFRQLILVQQIIRRFVVTLVAKPIGSSHRVFLQPFCNG